MIIEAATPKSAPLLRRFLLGLSMSCALTAFSTPALALDNTPQPSAQTPGLEGREWHISQFFVGDILSWPHPQNQWVPKPHIEFAGGNIKGSPGCGQFTGTYHLAGARLTISAKWEDDKKTPCNADEKNDATKILQAIANVSRIDAEPSYWHSDSLLLKNENEKIQITLSPMHVGKDFSELHDSFWNLTQLEGVSNLPSDAIVDIGQSDISFSTPTYYATFPFQYLQTGLKIFPAWSHTVDKQTPLDSQTAKAFENILHETDSYERSQDKLTFFDKNHHAIMGFVSLPQTGIENRRWRIAKRIGDSSHPADADGLSDINAPAWLVLLHGRVTGSPGCGGFTGTYNLSGDKLTWHLGVIADLCANLNEPYTPGHTAYDPFNSELQVEKRGDQILLRDKNGKAQILLVPY